MSWRDPKTPYGFPPERPAFEAFPVEPPWDLPISQVGWSLELRCDACGKGASYPLRLLAAELGWQMTLRQVVPRLSCRECRRRPSSVVLFDERYDRGAKVSPARHDLSAAIGG